MRVRPTFGYHQAESEPIKGKDLPHVAGQRSEELWQRAKQIVTDLGYKYEETTRKALGGAYGVTMRPLIEGQGEKTILATGERVIQNSNWIIDQLNPQAPSDEAVETLQRTQTRQQQRDQSQVEQARETTPARSRPPLPGIGEVPQIKKLDHPTQHPAARRAPNQTASLALHR